MSVYVGSALLVAFYIGITVTQIVMTTPKSGETWITHIFSEDEHNDQFELSIPFASVGFVFDVFLLILPLGAIWKLQLPSRRKIGIILIFMTGLLYDKYHNLEALANTILQRLYSVTTQCLLPSTV